MINKVFSFLIVLFCLLLLAEISPAFASDLADLPPRPVPPTPPKSTPNDDPEAGAKIRLNIPLDSNLAHVDSETWTQVQWRDADGHWHDVTGWRGTLYFNPQLNQWETEWWVDQEHFGTGPYKWVVELKSKHLETEPFHLSLKGMSRLNLQISSLNIKE